MEDPRGVAWPVVVFVVVLRPRQICQVGLTMQAADRPSFEGDNMIDVIPCGTVGINVGDLDTISPWRCLLVVDQLFAANCVLGHVARVLL